MHGIALWLALLAAPFWETKAPREWTDDELRSLLTESPWAQSGDTGTIVYLATARPMREAEQERSRRKKLSDPDYEEFLEQDHGQHIVLAIAYRNAKALADAAEAKKMENDSVLKIGKRKFQMTGHFPPTPADPVLRLIYPREIKPGDKSLVFDLYLPGMGFGYHSVEFKLKELLYRGTPEM